MVKLSAQLVPIKLNAEKEGTAVAKKYKVAGYPTILFLDAGGAEVYKIGGYLPPADFAAQMESAILAGQLPKIVAAYKRNPRDTSTLARLVRIYAGKGNPAQAGAYLQKLRALNPAASLMAPVYNSVGDMYQTSSQWDTAVDNFKKAVEAAAASRNNSAQAYALISIATVYNQSGRIKEAAPYLKKLLAMGPEKAPYEDSARQMLKAAGGN